MKKTLQKPIIMKTLQLLFILSFLLGGLQQAFGQIDQEFLVKQLEYSHTNENWFAPVNIAMDDLSAKNANWHDDSGNHSIAQLVSHLVFWNERLLKAMQGKDVAEFDGNNDITFSEISEEDWKNMTQKLDQILSEIEEETKKMNEEQFAGWKETLANIAAHNAYHTGQIVYIRKQNGWWR